VYGNEQKGLIMNINKNDISVINEAILVAIECSIGYYEKASSESSKLFHKTNAIGYVKVFKKLNGDGIVKFISGVDALKNKVNDLIASAFGITYTEVRADE